MQDYKSSVSLYQTSMIQSEEKEMPRNPLSGDIRCLWNLTKTLRHKVADQ